MSNSDIPVRHTDSDTAHGDESPEAIRADIERTRAEMSETIDAIQERLSPEVLKTQAKEAIREATVGKAEEFMSQMEYTARSKGSSMWETIKQNPMPAALAGIGLGWLVKSSRKDSHDYHPRYQNAGREAGWRGAYGQRYPIGYGEHESNDMRDRAGEMAGRVGDRAGDMASRAGEMAGDVKDRAGEMAGRVGDRAGDMAMWAREEGSDLFEMVRRNPVPAALAGISIGWMVMNNRRSDHYEVSRYGYADRGAEVRGSYGTYGAYGASGEHRDGRDRAGEVADQAKHAADSARHRAGEVVGGVSERAGDVADRAREQVSNLGEQAQYGMYRAKDMAYENPMLMGAVALGLGALVGMILPETRKEHEWMGEAKENLVEKAKDKAVDAVQEARSQVINKVADTVQHVADDVKDRAEEAKESSSTSSGQTSGQTNYASGQQSKAA